MSSKPIIKCNGIGKAFQLYAHQNDQLKQVLFGYWKKFYKEKWVLNDISFSVNRGERVGIVDECHEGGVLGGVIGQDAERGGGRCRLCHGASSQLTRR